MPGPDYIVDLTGDHPDESVSLRDASPPRQRRPWLAVQWNCCRAYSRIYRNSAGTAYVGHCPKCAKRVNVPIGPGGTDQRFFGAH